MRYAPGSHRRLELRDECIPRRPSVEIAVKLLDLFSGIGAWTLAADALQIQTAAMCENNPRKIAFLKEVWPNIPIYDDIKTFPADEFVGRIDIASAGVPCQPASRAGKQRGAEDDRWLWDETIAVVKIVRPWCCVFENPPGIEDVGLDGILAEVEAIGYEIGPIFDIPACAVNSPQLRQRYYIVGFANDQGRSAGEHAATPPGHGRSTESTTGSVLADSVGQGHQERGMLRGIPEVAGCRDARETADVEIENGMAHSLSKHGQSGMQHQESGSPGRNADWGPGAECMADPRQVSGDAGRTARSDQIESRWSCDQTERLLAGTWDDFVWLPCADGKVRRAPDNAFGLVDGLHRSILGALGESQVPQIAYQILSAIKTLHESLDTR